MADWMAGLAGGFGGASDFLRMLMAQKERDRDRTREDERFDKQFDFTKQTRGEDVAFREGQERRSADQFARQLAYQQQQADALERDRKAQDVIDFGRASGVNYDDPRRVTQMRDIAQLPSGVGGMGMPDVSGMLGQMGRGAKSGTASAVNTALAEAARTNQAGRYIDSPMGGIFVENRQFNPNQAATQGMRGDQLRASFADKLTAYHNSTRLDRVSTRQQVMASMPQIEQKYGRALLGNDPTMTPQEANQQVEMEFGPMIEAEVNKQMDMRAKAQFQTLRTAFPTIPAQEIWKSIYGSDMPGTSLADIIREAIGR